MKASKLQQSHLLLAIFFIIVASTAAASMQDKSPSTISKQQQLVSKVGQLVFGKQDGSSNDLSMIKHILRDPKADRRVRKQLLKQIAGSIRAMTKGCPPSLPASFCKQPLTFFLWLKEVRNKERERANHAFVKQFIKKLYGGKEASN